MLYSGRDGDAVGNAKSGSCSGVIVPCKYECVCVGVPVCFVYVCLFMFVSVCESF